MIEHFAIHQSRVPVDKIVRTQVCTIATAGPFTYSVLLSKGVLSKHYYDQTRLGCRLAPLMASDSNYQFVGGVAVTRW